MTLDEMLALLPDNDAGDISAADMRAVVTGLHELAGSFAQVFAYQWVFPPALPTSGEADVGPTWDLSADTLHLSETAMDGHQLTFGVIDLATNVSVWVVNEAGSRMVATVTGPSVDLGESRTIPIAVDSVTGAVPEEGTPVTVALWVTL